MKNYTTELGNSEGWATRQIGVAEQLQKKGRATTSLTNNKQQRTWAQLKIFTAFPRFSRDFLTFKGEIELNFIGEKSIYLNCMEVLIIVTISLTFRTKN